MVQRLRALLNFSQGFPILGSHLIPTPMPPNFTGRTTEREMLSRWLEADGDHPLLVLRALGGFGKSALTWLWLLHDVDPAHWPVTALLCGLNAL